MRLGEPQRVESNARIEFRGSGPARFRLQHARDCNGAPDDLSWCDVTQVSNGALQDPEDAVDSDGMVRGVLVDVVDGDVDFLYRRHRAQWLRVVPFDEFDAEVVKRCKTYAVRITPLPKGASSSA